MRQVDIAVQRKRLIISEKKPGTITKDHPTIIYTTTLRRPEKYKWPSKLASISALRSKFSSLLNECAAKQDNKIMHLRSCCTIYDFNNLGNLTPKGKTQLWHEVDDILERFENPAYDRVPITLQPRIHQQDHHNHCGRNSERHFRSQAYN